MKEQFRPMRIIARTSFILLLNERTAVYGFIQYYCYIMFFCPTPVIKTSVRLQSLTENNQSR